MDFLPLEPAHQDLVNDIAFDYYGKRFATCSSDKHIKVWTLDEEKGIWTSDDIQQRAHQDSVWRLSWAHPEFGQLIASCSEDNTIRIWEEQGSVGDSSSTGKWMRKALLGNSNHPVRDVKFSHRGLGLTLAAACADGFVRIYEARDVFDLTKWELKVRIILEDAIVSQKVMLDHVSSGKYSQFWGRRFK
jgi:WD40 repeat protein